LAWFRHPQRSRVAVTEVVAVTEAVASMAAVTEAVASMEVASAAVDFAEAGGVEPELALLV
jgi:hypothetical protein